MTEYVSNITISIIVFIRIFITVSVFLCLIFFIPILFSPVDDVFAGAARWSNEILPADGQMGMWQLAAGSDVQHLTVSPDGTLFCHAVPELTGLTLFRSGNNGTTWTPCGNVTDIIVDIAVSDNDPKIVIYATASSIYKSNDGGITFVAIPLHPGGAEDPAIKINSIDVTGSGSGVSIITGTVNIDPGKFGGVYIWKETGWVDTVIGDYNVLKVKFTPDYATDKAIFALATDNNDTVITSRRGDEIWGGNAGPAVVTGLVAVSGDIAFPADYATAGYLYAGISTGDNKGNAFRITPGTLPAPAVITGINPGAADGLASIDIYSMSVNSTGDQTLIMAGSAGSSRVYTSHDNGTTWQSNQKPPTGQNRTTVACNATGNIFFAATSGLESAFSISTDAGRNWHQVSLIDTRISNIIDFSVASSYSHSPTLFMVTHDSTRFTHSVWRREMNSSQWQRIFCSVLPGIDHIRYVLCSPGTGSRTVFLTGENLAGPALWVSDDSGLNFREQTAPCVVTAWAAVDNATLFIAGYSGGNGVVVRSDNAGATFHTPEKAGNNTIHSIVVSPDFSTNQIIIAGNINGQVFWSNSGGKSFEQVGQHLPRSDGIGMISLAFGYDTAPGIIYAATHLSVNGSNRERIFRFTLQQSNQWQSIYAGLPEEASITRLICTREGQFYALNSQPVGAAEKKGGMIRTLSVIDPSFQTITAGISERAIVNGLWANWNTFWTIDTVNIALLKLVDHLTQPVVLKQPADQAVAMDTDVTIDWYAVEGATEYEWQLSDHAAFGNLATIATGKGTATSIRVEALKPGVNYYWRVRVTQPFPSPWSYTQSFVTRLGTDTGITLNQPAGGTMTELKPVFQWNPVAGADRYELVVARDNQFQDILFDFSGEFALNANAWQCTENLDYDTAYFWKVRACNRDNHSDWSAVNAFTTRSAPLPERNTEYTIVIEMPENKPVPVPTQQINIYTPENPPPIYSPTNIVEFSIPSWAMIICLSIIGVIAIITLVLMFLLIRILRS